MLKPNRMGSLYKPAARLTPMGRSLTLASAMKTITAFLCALALSPVLALAADYGEISHADLKKAIEEKEVLTGMDKEMVLLAKNRPDNKYRETKDGVETEDWIYGKPPGDVVFVTFQDGKVVLHVDPRFSRPMIWRQFQMETQEADGIAAQATPTPETA